MRNYFLKIRASLQKVQRENKIERDKIIEEIKLDTFMG